VRNNERKGNDSAVESPSARNTTTSGPNARDRGRGGASLIAVTAPR
jgi:hypothetical protein